MIRLHRVTKSYPTGSTALHDVTLHVEKGQFVFLTGPSGAGKTTLLRLLMREELPTSGSVVVDGRDVAALPARQVPYLRRRIGFVFQDFRLIQSRTVLENLTIVQEAVGVPWSQQKERALRLLRQVSLQHRMHAYPIQLSGGEQQRVATARALVNEPVLLLADEPTGNLDAERAEEILDLMREINAHGTTVLIATHDREMVRRMARRVVQLSAGRIVEPPATAARVAAAGRGAPPPA